jgi:hypothetical protein
MDFFIEAMSQSSGTIALISVLSGAGVFVIMSTLANQILGFFLYPFTIFASLCVSKLFQDFHFYGPRAFDKWILFTIFSAAIGMGLSLIVYILLSRLFGITWVARNKEGLNDLRVRRIQLDARK